ncbi:hypothetical protein [Fulvivirga sediminis]|uniref:Lipoprotein SmpA/OmlA domain-containing protein n=1 Tax=Fulvivirga sediminis TaxID=2803949 RepID=A0A937K2D0_9BACT|nr:hypothetical protein [Fulvivirga sediminis]MBL3658240.1 hypothetical protein [Fulvivirga sediminis]
MNKYLLSFILIALAACNSKQINIPGFDENLWQQDTNGCQKIRAEMTDSLEQHRDLLKGLSQDEMISLLGKPDKNELYKRNQKFFIYEIIDPEHCTAASKQHIYLSIRFNATGMAKEVQIYKE